MATGSEVAALPLTVSPPVYAASASACEPASWPLRRSHPTDRWAVVGVVMVVTVSSCRSSSMRAAVVEGAQRLSLDMSTYLSLLVDFDFGGEWAFDNARSCAHWVA